MSHREEAALRRGARVDTCEVRVVNAERVAATRARLVGADDAREMAEIFRVLGDPSRCRLVCALIDAGEICVCDLACVLDMRESNVSHHLRVLRDHRLVRARREGKMVFYSPDDAHIASLLALARDHVGHRDTAV